MIQNSPVVRPASSPLPTLWGLDPVQLHDRYWAARGVCVVRPGTRTALPDDAELFMLTDSRTLTLFRLRTLVDRLYWVKPAVVFVRLRSTSKSDYRETVVADERGRFERLVRDYGATSSRTARIALTRDHRVAAMWQATDGARTTWRSFRRQTRAVRRETQTLEGRYYDSWSDLELDQLVTDLIARWPKPSTTIGGATQARPGVWSEAGNRVAPTASFIGPVWIGAGRRIAEGASVVGPAALWDDPASRPAMSAVEWTEIEPAAAAARAAAVRQQQTPSWRRATKRWFDIAFALAALLVTLPLYPFIMLAIWIEDGRPFFFAHKRETIGGREFGCLKFRSMRKDADRIKAQMGSTNQSDGPQFFVENDPRQTRVGRLLRKLNIDEFPQFINVLLGHMSVVGPRPSPRSENQYCPEWREARLSVRPGITGLWQVSRTRRRGLDFQEWIRFDIEYVQRGGWRLDLTIIFKTFRLLTGW
jgi:lipopolysaccharide/colanic/teichoic acid biosynthesis glycosyltransferase